MISMFNTGYDLQNQLDGVKNGIAIVATNNTHIAITSGQYVYIQDHSTLAEGLYRATANIAANATLYGSNVTAVSGGGLNALNSKLNEFNDAYGPVDGTSRNWIANADLNTMKTSGLYPIGSSPTNAPAVGGWGILEVSAPRQDTIEQTYRIFGAEKYFYIREYRNNTWSDWQRIAFKSDLDNKVSISNFNGYIKCSGGMNKRYCYLNYSDINSLWGGMLFANSSYAWLLTLTGSSTSASNLAQLTNSTSVTPPTITVDEANSRIIIDYSSTYVHWMVIVFGQASSAINITFA